MPLARFRFPEQRRFPVIGQSEARSAGNTAARLRWKLDIAKRTLHPLRLRPPKRIVRRPATAKELRQQAWTFVFFAAYVSFHPRLALPRTCKACWEWIAKRRPPGTAQPGKSGLPGTRHPPLNSPVPLQLMSRALVPYGLACSHRGRINLPVPGEHRSSLGRHRGALGYRPLSRPRRSRRETLPRGQWLGMAGSWEDRPHAGSDRARECGSYRRCPKFVSLNEISAGRIRVGRVRLRS
jgi:hypothetical protein